jgi:hypothetical protein
MDFSRLDDTKFPHMEMASPYALKNTFDYTRWVPDTRVHLVNVLWDNDYANVVRFEDDRARDSWFDNITGTHTLTLKSNARVVPDGTVKLPVPYDVAVMYNYMYVDIPIATSSDEMIQYEVAGGVRRWYLFVDNVTYSAPNTTIVHVELDVWTQFIGTTSIEYMMLERGHAPVSVTDVDTYLNNPIANNRYLLAPDVTYDDRDVTRSSKFIPFGTGTKYVCIASTCGYWQIQNNSMGTVGEGMTWGAPTYEDTGDWFGYQLRVNGYGYGNGRDYGKLTAPVAMGNRAGPRVPTGLDVYAIPASDNEFLADVRKKSPAFLRTIKAIFVVDESMLTLGIELSMLGHKIWRCTGVERKLDEYRLTSDMFHFDEHERRFAKLYTYPYSRIEVSDNDGKTVEVRIEDTGVIGMRILTSVAFPVLDFRILLTGIGGLGTQSYKWKSLNNDELDKYVTNGDWGRLTFEYDIPTFALYMDTETAWFLDMYGTSIDQARRKALVDYHTTVRTANLGYTNDRASADTAQGNSVRQANSVNANSLADNDTSNRNAQDSANTANSNAVNSADTYNTNAQTMAGTNRDNAVDGATTTNTNAQNSTATMKTNADNSIECAYQNVNLTVAGNAQCMRTANTNSMLVTTQKNNQASAQIDWSNTLMVTTTDINNQTSVATTENNAVSTVTTSAMRGAMSGAMMGAGDPVVGGIGAAAGTIVGAVTGGIEASTSMANATIITQANSAVTNATVAKNLHVMNSDNSYNISITKSMNENNVSQCDINNTTLSKQSDANRLTANTNSENVRRTQSGNAKRAMDTAISNANRTRDTSVGNAGRERDMSVGNADRTHATVSQNATRTRETADTNANRTRDTAIANARDVHVTSNANTARTREIGVINAKERLENARSAAMTAQLDARRKSPVQLTEASGDASMWYHGMTGLQFRLRTQSDSAIAQTASQFARYGYALNQAWKVSDLNLMRNFTYWKASDVWVDVRDVAGSAVGDAIGDILRRGVTVWRDPDKIGKVSVYDN